MMIKIIKIANFLSTVVIVLFALAGCNANNHDNGTHAVVVYNIVLDSPAENATEVDPYTNELSFHTTATLLGVDDIKNITVLNKDDDSIVEVESIKLTDNFKYKITLKHYLDFDKNYEVHFQNLQDEHKVIVVDGYHKFKTIKEPAIAPISFDSPIDDAKAVNIYTTISFHTNMALSGIDQPDNIEISTSQVPHKKILISSVSKIAGTDNRYEIKLGNPLDFSNSYQVKFKNIKNSAGKVILDKQHKFQTEDNKDKFTVIVNSDVNNIKIDQPIPLFFSHLLHVNVCDPEDKDGNKVHLRRFIELQKIVEGMPFRINNVTMSSDDCSNVMLTPQSTLDPNQVYRILIAYSIVDFNHTYLVHDTEDSVIFTVKTME